MQAQIEREGDIVIVHLSGRVDVETAEIFRTACLSRLRGSKVIFDFSSLSFVGSSGILPFLETMKAFADSNPYRFKLSGLGSEFRKVFAATPLQTIEIYDNNKQAVSAYLNPPPMVAAQAVPQVVRMVDSLKTIEAADDTTDESAEETIEPDGFLEFRSPPEDMGSSDEDFESDEELDQQAKEAGKGEGQARP
jgi:anti-anti-sigma factor